ncbi:hypothetical protein [Caldilinea sp.]|uniref:hypothetical protein n=1 Tax=Caldilinea sp. TaxID=2293560 RepID=UPI0025872002|nr:hypothetical protein [Caldilinea sp.]
MNEFAAQVRQYAPETGGDMLTYAEELRQEGLQEGLQKGELKGKLETIESLLAVGTEWSLITRATGITPEEFERLKAEVRGLKADRPLEGDQM